MTEVAVPDAFEASFPATPLKKTKTGTSSNARKLKQVLQDQPIRGLDVGDDESTTTIMRRSSSGSMQDDSSPYSSLKRRKSKTPSWSAVSHRAKRNGVARTSGDNGSVASTATTVTTRSKSPTSLARSPVPETIPADPNTPIRVSLQEEEIKEDFPKAILFGSDSSEAPVVALQRRLAELREQMSAMQREHKQEQATWKKESMELQRLKREHARLLEDQTSQRMHDARQADEMARQLQEHQQQLLLQQQPSLEGTTEALKQARDLQTQVELLQQENRALRLERESIEQDGQKRTTKNSRQLRTILQCLQATYPNELVSSAWMEGALQEWQQCQTDLAEQGLLPEEKELLGKVVESARTHWEVQRQPSLQLERNQEKFEDMRLRMEAALDEALVENQTLHQKIVAQRQARAKAEEENHNLLQELEHWKQKCEELQSSWDQSQSQINKLHWDLATSHRDLESLRDEHSKERLQTQGKTSVASEQLQAQEQSPEQAIAALEEQNGAMLKETVKSKQRTDVKIATLRKTVESSKARMKQLLQQRQEREGVSPSNTLVETLQQENAEAKSKIDNLQFSMAKIQVCVNQLEKERDEAMASLEKASKVEEQLVQLQEEANNAQSLVGKLSKERDEAMEAKEEVEQLRATVATVQDTVAQIQGEKELALAAADDRIQHLQAAVYEREIALERRSEMASTENEQESEETRISRLEDRLKLMHTHFVHREQEFLVELSRQKTSLDSLFDDYSVCRKKLSKLQRYVDPEAERERQRVLDSFHLIDMQKKTKNTVSRPKRRELIQKVEPSVPPSGGGEAQFELINATMSRDKGGNKAWGRVVGLFSGSSSTKRPRTRTLSNNEGDPKARVEKLEAENNELRSTLVKVQSKLQEEVYTSRKRIQELQYENDAMILKNLALVQQVSD